MKVLNAIAKWLDKLTDTAAFIILLLFFLIGVYAFYDTYMLFYDANDSSILRYKPGYRDGENAETGGREISDDMVAWLEIKDTTVDYPVMQGRDNSEYLNKDPFGEYALAGSIFLDSRNSASFTDPYSLIYGHHMDHGAMFGALDDYLDESFFNSHRDATLTIGETERKLRIFAVLEADALELAVFSPKDHYEETMPYLLEHALYLDTSALPGEGETLVGLSTCKYPDTLERTIIYAALEPDGMPVVWESYG